MGYSKLTLPSVRFNAILANHMFQVVCFSLPKLAFLQLNMEARFS